MLQQLARFCSLFYRSLILTVFTFQVIAKRVSDDWDNYMEKPLI